MTGYDRRIAAILIVLCLFDGGCKRREAVSTEPRPRLAHKHQIPEATFEGLGVARATFGDPKGVEPKWRYVSNHMTASTIILFPKGLANPRYYFTMRQDGMAWFACETKDAKGIHCDWIVKLFEVSRSSSAPEKGTLAIYLSKEFGFSFPTSLAGSPAEAAKATRAFAAYQFGGEGGLKSWFVDPHGSPSFFDFDSTDGGERPVTNDPYRITSYERDRWSKHGLNDLNEDEALKNLAE